MGRDIRVILIDLLVERSEFGHGGNQEVIQPIAEGGSVEVLLVTPQMQSEEVGLRAQEEGLVRISESDVPNWDYEYPFWEECSMEMFGNDVIFRRVAMPLHGDDALTEGWIRTIEPDAVVRSGSSEERYDVGRVDEWRRVSNEVLIENGDSNPRNLLWPPTSLSFSRGQRRKGRVHVQRGLGTCTKFAWLLRRVVCNQRKWRGRGPCSTILAP